MSNQRTSNFKKKTATDSKQDDDISTLSTTVSNIVVPNWSTQKATTDVDMDNKIIKNCSGLGSISGDLILYSPDSNVLSASTFVAPYILSTGNIITNTTLETNTITPQSGTLTLEGNMTANNLTCNKVNLGGVDGVDVDGVEGVDVAKVVVDTVVDEVVEVVVAVLVFEQ
jgi:hypothetical protein